MIIILTGSVKPWFKYIWEQFVQINGLKDEYMILKYSDYSSSSSNGNSWLIEYHDKQVYPTSLFFQKKDLFETDDYVWLRQDFPVFRKTISAEGADTPYDIFYNAFVHLSRIEEWEQERKGRRIRSYSFNHPRRDKRIWKLPIVNYLFDELERRIKLKYPGVIFESRQRPLIEFSHDVDYIRKTSPLRIKQGGFYLFNFFKHLLMLHFKRSMSKARKCFNFVFTDSIYLCFNRWMELESQLGVTSVYYFFAGARRKRFYDLKEWLLDPSYEISNDEVLRESCFELLGSGHKIGMHGSYYAAQDVSLFEKEKQVLELVTGGAITKNRQHWLNYIEGLTPFIYERSGIKEDSTCGFNDIPGFRAGIASAYNPYDHKNARAFSFKEIPLVLMDSHLYDYSDNFHMGLLTWLWDAVRHVKKTAISLNWHQRVIHEDYQWSSSFQEIAKALKSIPEEVRG